MREVVDMDSEFKRETPSNQLSEVRIPPQNLDAEQSVIGAMLLSKEAIEIAVQICREEDFYKEIHRKLFKIMVDLSDRGAPVDVITLVEELRRTASLESFGGISELTAFMERVPTPANIEYYATIVREKSVARQLIVAASQIVSEAYSGSQPLAELLDQSESLIFKATDLRKVKDFASMRDLIGNSFEYVHNLAQHQIHLTGVPTGFSDLDELTAGFQRGELIVLGARPSMGKTSLALNIAQHVSMGSTSDGRKRTVGFFSLEMTAEQLALRLLCSVAKIDLKRARSGYLNDPEKVRLNNLSGKLYETKLFIDDTSSMTVLELKAKARRLEKKEKIDLIIVDYLQLIQAGIRADTREQEIAYISRQLKALAKDLSVPILVLSQLSRQPKGQEDRRPILSDLRESGAIEQDADVVIFIHREVSKEDFNSPKYELVLSKQRNGPTGEVPIIFKKEYTTFEPMSKISSEPH
jgi:replicative DNA helicase